MKILKYSLFLNLSLRKNVFFTCRSCANLSEIVGGENEKNDLSAMNMKLSPSDEKKKLLIQMEMNFEKQSGNFFIPDDVPSRHWKELLKMNSSHERKKYYKYLKKTELHTKNKQEKHLKNVMARRAKREEMKSKNPDHIQYGLGKNSLFTKVRKSSLIRPFQNNLRDAILFGQKLVIDAGYEDIMNVHELQSCVEQINMAYGVNKIDSDPFYLHICNVNMNGKLLEKLKLSLPFLEKPYPLITITEKSYLDIFPKRNLVYLTSHCDENLKTYNHDDIYIIGGLVDKNQQGAVSLAKAKREGLRMARFPLEAHVKWGCGFKSLTVDQVMRILITMKSTLDWRKAFEHVPSRKLRLIVPSKQFD